jgi:hypothetical protein
MAAFIKAALLTSCLSVCIILVLMVKDENYVNEVSILQTQASLSGNLPVLARQKVLSSKFDQQSKRSLVKGPDTDRDILLMKEIQQAMTEHEMEKKLNKLLQENAKLSEQNKRLEQMVESAESDDHQSKSDDKKHQAHHETSDSIPAPTVMAPPPPPPADFNGARAVLANPPGDFRFEPAVGNSELDISGKEERGSLVLEKKVRVRRKGQHHKPGTYFRVRGRAGHHIDCTLRGFRVLTGEFKDATVTTGE